ncbi:FKBP-type peptidyl-prolyl cis-trans isomerase [Jiulongibacter sp. NS-SX5]|uniref:FKBP-type peptidyl-prolyl cis-trans isomerase n=1 Tax=Jiulongibacter sp. NS-SX5 TaxID=3463854 RepID=UPI00405A2EED
MRKISILLSSFLIFSLTACEKSEFKGKESQQIQQYIQSKGLTVTESRDSGLQFILLEENPAGESLSTGDYVKVIYSGRFLSDEIFDAGQFSFTLGIGQVVKGFDEGISLMKVGEKATIIFPSSLGYGNKKQGSIPKNSPLIFNIDVVAKQ